PLRDLSAVWHDKAAGRAALEALERLEGLTPRMDAAPEPSPRSDSAAVRLTGVTFGYDDDAAAIVGLDLTVAQGQNLALTGPSGSGKSTLLALMAGLLPPRAGEIFVEGKRPAATEGPKIAWIGQVPHVFTGTIRSNVRLGR